MPNFPFWTIETTRRHGIRRRPVQLLTPQTYPEAVGQWLVDYRETSGDLGFTEIRVLEHPMPGIEPIDSDPHLLIQTLRDTTRRIQTEQDAVFGRYRRLEH